MLKKYIDRDSSDISSVNIVNSVPPEQNQMDSEDKRLELKHLILKYEHLFTDIPSRTDNIYHDS